MNWKMNSRVFPGREVWMTVLGKWITTAKEVVSMGNPNLSGVMKAYNVGGTMVGIDTGSVN